MLRLLLILDQNDILCLFYSHFCPNVIIFKVHKRSFMDLKYYFNRTEISKQVAIEYIDRMQSQEKSSHSNKKNVFVKGSSYV